MNMEGIIRQYNFEEEKNLPQRGKTPLWLIMHTPRGIIHL